MSDNSHRPLILIKCVMGVAFETEHKHFILPKKQNWPYPTAQTKKNVCLLVTSAPIRHGYNSMKMEKEFKQWRKKRSWFIQRPHTTWFFIDESNNRHLFLEIVVYTCWVFLCKHDCTYCLDLFKYALSSQKKVIICLMKESSHN